MKLCTPAEMRAIEAAAMKSDVIPEHTLMENAGRGAAEVILRRFAESIRSGGVAIVCGPGKNGGDGLVVARQLAAAGIGKIKVIRLADIDAVPDFSDCSLIVDALYGIGLNRPLQDKKIDRVIERMHRSGKPVVSLDLPSGLNGATGISGGAAVKADLTLTFAVPKIGFYTPTGGELCGDIEIVPIGCSAKTIAANASTYRLFDAKLARRLLPERKLSDNKSVFGHLAVCAGRPGFWGAGVLASQAAFRIGAGYVTWAAEAAPVSELKFHPEVLTASVSDLFSGSKKYSAFVVGPGLGIGESTRRLIERLPDSGQPVVLDADALTVLASQSGRLPANWILTPHTGEMSRLLGVSAATVESDRFTHVRKAAEKFGCLVLLKGYRTLVASARRCWAIDAGNPALAKAGTGDVLAGLIGGLLAQGLTPWRAATLGAFLHGRLADEWVRSGKDVASLVASDLTETMPVALANFRSEHFRRGER